MLFAVLPFAIVDTPVFPFEDAHTLSLIIDEVALVLLAIGPFEQASSMHLILLPFASVLLAIWPNVSSITTDFIPQEGTCVDGTIGEGKRPLAIFLAILVAAIVSSTIRPCFNTLTMLLVFEPVAYICRSICMPVGAMPVSLVVKPETFVDIAIGMDQYSLSVCLIVFPHALVAR